MKCPNCKLILDPFGVHVCKEPMTDMQQDHLDHIVHSFEQEVREKYANGVKQHGGNLWEKGLEFQITQAMQEAVDLYVYLFSAREDVRNLDKRLQNVWQGRQ